MYSLSEAKTSHSQRMWAKVSSSTPSPSSEDVFSGYYGPVIRPITTLDCVLLKDNFWSVHSD